MSESLNKPYFATLRKLFWPTLLLLLLLGPFLYWEDYLNLVSENLVGYASALPYYIRGVAFWLVLAWFLVRLLDVTLWELVSRRLGSEVPNLLKNLASGIILLFAVSIIVGVVFELPVTGLWTTSGVVGLVIGLALRNIIADVFSGLALHVERSFRIGDWITLHPEKRDSVSGKVVEINWRTTQLRTKDDTVVVVPNNQISAFIINNLSRPARHTRYAISFFMDQDLPPERILRILLAGVKGAEGVLSVPEPNIYIEGVQAGNVEYKIYFWMDIVEEISERVRHRVALSVLDHLHHAGISPAFQKQDIYWSRMPSRQLKPKNDRATLLARVELFTTLSAGELDFLAQNLSEKLFQVGDTLFRQGEAGDSMYLVVEGLLNVYIAGGEHGWEVKVGQLTPGEFFGEMSLLTGENRTATIIASTDCVVYQITREVLRELLRQRPEIAEQMTRVVAERRLLNEQYLGRMAHAAPRPELNLAGHLLNRMRQLFSF